jgi:hypothetical protein
VEASLILDPLDQRLEFSSSRCAFMVPFQSHTQGVQ